MKITIQTADGRILEKEITKALVINLRLRSVNKDDRRSGIELRLHCANNEINDMDKYIEEQLHPRRFIRVMLETETCNIPLDISEGTPGETDYAFMNPTIFEDLNQKENQND